MAAHQKSMIPLAKLSTSAHSAKKVMETSKASQYWTNVDRNGNIKQHDPRGTPLYLASDLFQDVVLVDPKFVELSPAAVDD